MEERKEGEEDTKSLRYRIRSTSPGTLGNMLRQNLRDAMNVAFFLLNQPMTLLQC